MRHPEPIANVGGTIDSDNNNQNVSNNKGDGNQNTFTTGAQKVSKQ